LNGFPRGTKTTAQAEGLFEEVKLNRGRSGSKAEVGPGSTLKSGLTLPAQSVDATQACNPNCHFLLPDCSGAKHPRGAAKQPRPAKLM
jgi:hypothetical protein